MEVVVVAVAVHLCAPLFNLNTFNGTNLGQGKIFRDSSMAPIHTHTQ